MTEESVDFEAYFPKFIKRMFELSETEYDGLKSDETLVEEGQHGDLKAVEVLLKKYTPLVLSVCKDKFLPGADEEDLLQEGFIGVLGAIKQFDESQGMGFAGFASLCVKRRIANALKLANRKKHSPLNTYVSLNDVIRDDEGNSFEDELSETAVAPENLSPEEILIKNEEEQLLNTRLTEVLTHLELDVLLSIVDGFSYAETAKRLGVSEKSVDNARQRIKNKLIKNIFS
jgi:RNA polymerase sporulation-specific sigma factor